MPKCPNCKAEVDSLLHYAPEVVCYKFWLSNGEPDYSMESMTEADPIPGMAQSYDCPECNEVLFTTEAEAVAFLKGA